MSIYHVTQDELRGVKATTFGAEGIMERGDLQRLLKKNIGVIDADLLVVAEEFGWWLDSSRRIDLLCLDRDANLVVVELKRKEDGGHMELQALRYAAMISAMTFDQLVETYARYLNSAAPDLQGAQAEVLQFLGWSEPEEERFAQDTRLVLAAPDFSKELTTAVMWLIERGVDIRCIRMKPYRMAEGPILLDVQQIIPLPEVTEFQTQIGFKKQAERKSLTDRHDSRITFWQGLLAVALEKTDAHANRKPSREGWMYAGAGRAGFSFGYTVRQADSQVEVWIFHPGGPAEKNKAAFRALAAQKKAIESDFGSALDWQELLGGEGCRIRFLVPGGYRSPVEQWPQIHKSLSDAMVRLEKAFRSRIQKLEYKSGEHEAHPTSGLPTIALDSDPESADWTRKTWDLPPYRSQEFNALHPDIESFKKMPVYKFAVEAGLIVNDQWAGTAGGTSPGS